MHVLITGGTGFIGQVLCKQLVDRGDQCTVLSRMPANVSERCGPQVQGVGHLSQLSDEHGIDAVINLAGQPIADARWTDARKKSLLDSRIGTTQQLIDWMANTSTPPKVLVSASAVGYYGDCGDKELNESSGFHDEFAHRLCEQWEQTAAKAQALGVRVSIARLGLVVGAGGGFLKRMVLPFKLGLGGRLGTGQQWFPWVHRDDVVAALIFMVDTQDAQGVYNVTAPNPVTNEVFTKTLATVVHRPAWFPVPEMVLKLGFGEMSELLLGGQRALPKRLQQNGFAFQYAELEAALRDAVAV